MSTVRIPPVLRSQTGGERQIEAEGQTVGEVLRHLADQYPALMPQLFHDGQLHRFVNVFVNDQDIQYLQQLDTPVRDQDTVIILPAMAGGGVALYVDLERSVGPR
jgi:molybdopterin converting factor small subunit